MRRTDLPHVTDILARAGLIDTQWFKEYDLSRGSAVHAATHFLDQGDLSWESVDPVIVGRLRSYQRFLDEVKPIILAIEEGVENTALRYCGTLDRRVMLRGREAVIDIKGPSRAAWQGIQVAMYAACFPRPLARYSLHLSDERYQLIEHKDRTDWDVAKAAITLVAWKERTNGSH